VEIIKVDAHFESCEVLLLVLPEVSEEAARKAHGVSGQVGVSPDVHQSERVIVSIQLSVRPVNTLF
jgi:hypothetical protein